jgi:hypothetical protein
MNWCCKNTHQLIHFVGCLLNWWVRGYHFAVKLYLTSQIIYPNTAHAQLTFS